MSNSEEKIFFQLKKIHNGILHVVYFGLILLYSILALSNKYEIANILQIIFIATLIVDSLLIFLLVFFVAEKKQDKYIITRLTDPFINTLFLTMIVFAITYTFFGIQIYIPFTAFVFLGLFAYLTSILAIAGVQFWEKDNDGNIKTEGERINALFFVFLGSITVMPILNILLTIKDFIKEGNIGSLIVVLLWLPQVITAIYFGIKVIYIDHILRRENFFLLLLISFFTGTIVLCFIFFGILNQQFEILLFSIISCVLCVLFFKQVNSVKLFWSFVFICLPAGVWGIFKIVPMDSINVEKLFSLLVDGCLWVLGTLLATILCTVILSMLKKKKEKQKTSLNDATLSDLIQVTSISLKIAEMIIENKPYNEENDIFKVQGIGQKRIMYLKEKFIF